MPAVRFSRDKRGYEYVYLVHTPTRRGKPGRTRVLYWYRSPPGVRIGRQPFDEEVQRSLEQQNPGVAFDWPAIIKAEMPPPDMTEFWRERRRAEKAARQERRAAEAEEPGDVAEPDATEPIYVAVTALAPDESGTEHGMTVDAADVELASEPVVDGAVADASQAGTAQKKRRRRRGGRRRKTAAGSVDTAEAGQSDDDAGPSGETGFEPADDEPSE